MLARLRLNPFGPSARCAACALTCLGCGVEAPPEPPEPSPFEGVWAYVVDAAGAGASIEGCGTSQSLVGVSPAIVDARTLDPSLAEPSRLSMVVGPRCRLQLDRGDGVAELDGEQDCELRAGLTTAVGRFSSFRIERTDRGTLRTSADGSGRISVEGVEFTCDLRLSGELERLGPPPERLPAHFVGVVPYSPDAPLRCPTGWNREPITVSMDDEDDSRCGNASGTRFEGRWLLPSAEKPLLSCPSLDMNGNVVGREFSELDFCRTSVESSAFRPLTTDPSAVEDFYAVLAFGDACPPNSTRIVKTIANEDRNNKNKTSIPLDRLEALFSPNGVTTADQLGNYTRLVFCYFRAAADPADTMQRFPDLGFAYAVFHDFEGRQPGWVLRKRWQFSDDSNNHTATGTESHYEPSPESDPVVREFEAVIENTRSFDTYFDMARVR